MFGQALSTVETWNGAQSQGSTGSARVDLFFKALRSTSDAEISRLTARAFAESESDTGKLVFQARDCRGGKGERDVFIKMIKWYLDSGRESFVQKHLKYVPYFGYWKDLNRLFGTKAEPFVIQLYVEMLTMDLTRLQRAKRDPENRPLTSISLAAKWVPNENSEKDQKFKAAKKIAKALGVTMKEYRKAVLRPLRQHIEVVEALMCNGEWDHIQYGQVPSICMMKHRKAFARNDAERFAAYLESVKKGDQKINASQLSPHELVHHYIGKVLQTENDTINAQWESLVGFHRAKCTLTNAIAVCDMSGSMMQSLGGNKASAYQVIDASIGMSMLIADCVAEPFRNQVITFSEKPRFHQIKGSTLKDRVADVLAISDWGMTTDFEAVFEMILQKAANYTYTDSNGIQHQGLPESEMPKTVFVFSDMQFNAARFCGRCRSGTNGYTVCSCPANQMTNLEAVRTRYQVAGYSVPFLVFWNLAGNTVDFPSVASDAGVALVSGYSPAIMKLFASGASMNPYNVMRSAIDDSRYDVIGCFKDLTLEELYYGKQVDNDEKVITIE